MIHEAYLSGVKDLLFLGSSCIYPKLATQPIKESALLTGMLEPTNEPYAIAKIAGIKLCESNNRQYGTDYRSVMPTNLYGLNDNFHPDNSHVIPALIRKFHEAKEHKAPIALPCGVQGNSDESFYMWMIWMMPVCVMRRDKETLGYFVEPMLSHINVGSGTDVTIKELEEEVAKVMAFGGKIEFDSTKPNGAFRKLMDVRSLKNMEWKATFPLNQGLYSTCLWCITNLGEALLRLE